MVWAPVQTGATDTVPLMIALAIFLFVLGAVVGSFLNVVAHRIPRGESIVRPGSRCPGCETPIRAYDNVPIISWVILRGRCRSCGEPISPRYPLVEFVTGALFVGMLLARGPHPVLWLGLLFISMLVVITLTDLDHRIIPNRVLLVAAIAGLALSAFIQPGRLPELAIAGGAAGGLLLAAALAYPAGMGMGDVKLAAVMGLFLGRSVAPALLIGFAAGTLIGIALIARHGAEARKHAVPFGPFLALGGITSQYFGPEMVDWYLDTFLET